MRSIGPFHEALIDALMLMTWCRRFRCGCPDCSG